MIRHKGLNGLPSHQRKLTHRLDDKEKKKNNNNIVEPKQILKDKS